MDVGWIGLGAMGAPMARRLLEAGHRVSGYDPVPAAREALAAAGGVAANDAAEAAAGAEVVVLMVATPGQAEQALFGAGGAAGALPPGALVLVAATVGDEAVVDWEARLAARAVRVVDAPVSGGVVRAEKGDLLVMPSGDPDDLAAVRPLLDALASAAEPVGSRVGDGQRMKLVNQLLCGAHIVAAAEALALAGALGLDRRQAWETVRRGAAASFMLDDRGERMLDPSPVVRSAVDIFVKDMGLVVEAAQRSGLVPSIAAAARSRFLAAHDAGWGRDDDSRVLDTYAAAAERP